MVGVYKTLSSHANLGNFGNLVNKSNNKFSTHNHIRLCRLIKIITLIFEPQENFFHKNEKILEYLTTYS